MIIVKKFTLWRTQSNQEKTWVLQVCREKEQSYENKRKSKAYGEQTTQMRRTFKNKVIKLSIFRHFLENQLEFWEPQELGKWPDTCSLQNKTKEKL